MNPLRPTIFLDFDGVLHPADYLRFESSDGELVLSGDSRFCWAEDLLNLLHGFEYDLVVHSSWRNSYSLDQLRDLLPVGLGQKVVAVTNEHDRYASILNYVNSHNVQSYVILDDTATEFPASCSELLLCKDGMGVSSREIQDGLKKFLRRAAPT